MDFGPTWAKPGPNLNQVLNDVGQVWKDMCRIRAGPDPGRRRILGSERVLHNRSYTMWNSAESTDNLVQRCPKICIRSGECMVQNRSEMPFFLAQKFIALFSESLCPQRRPTARSPGHPSQFPNLVEPPQLLPKLAQAGRKRPRSGESEPNSVYIFQRLGQSHTRFAQTIQASDEDAKFGPKCAAIAGGKANFGRRKARLGGNQLELVHRKTKLADTHASLGRAYRAAVDSTLQIRPRERQQAFGRTAARHGYQA